MDKDKDKCFACPECGEIEYHQNSIISEEVRVCIKCGQEWYADIDYCSVYKEKKT